MVGVNTISESFGFDNGRIDPHSGSWFLALGGVNADETAAQTVTTTAGASYHLQFFYTTDGGMPGDLNVFWNGNNIYSETNTGSAHGWVQHDFFVTGTGSDTLTFGSRNDPTWNGLDDVSLFAVGVPEPTTWAHGRSGHRLGWICRPKTPGQVAYDRCAFVSLHCHPGLCLALGKF